MSDKVNASHILVKEEFEAKTFFVRSTPFDLEEALGG